MALYIINRDSDDQSLQKVIKDRVLNLIDVDDMKYLLALLREKLNLSPVKEKKNTPDQID